MICPGSQQTGTSLAVFRASQDGRLSGAIRLRILVHLGMSHGQLGQASERT